MENLEKQLTSIMEVRGYQCREHQFRNILNYKGSKLPHVIAAATSAGKTVLMAAMLELYYMTGFYRKDEITIISAADKTILRKNFVKQFNDFFKEYGSSFSYRGIESSEDLHQALKDNVQVIIILPQLLDRYSNLFKGKKVKHFIVDEAHRWWFATVMPRILKKLKPKHKTLLTGTPFKFNRNKKDYVIDYTSVRTLYKQKRVSDVGIQVLHSSIPLHRQDYVGLLENLKKDTKLSKDDMNESFESMINQLVKILKIRSKSTPNFDKFTNKVMSVFGKMEKTVIFTHGIPECDYYFSLLEKHGIKVLKSHSKIKNEIAEQTFDEFKNNDEYKVLVTVDRGKEGFDFPDLYNIIDITYTQNFEVLMQMLGRLLRIPEIDKGIPKVFYKVSPRALDGYFTLLMDTMMQLFDDYWYQNFDGTNAISIPTPSNPRPRRRRNLGDPTNDDEDFNVIDVERLGINHISFMEKNVWHKQSDVLSVVSHTTLGDVMKKYGLWNPIEFRSFYEARDYVRSLNLQSGEQYKEWALTDQKPKDIPSNPRSVYKDLFVSMGDWLGTGRVADQLKIWKPFEEAREWARTLGLKTSKEWNEYTKREDYPIDIPKSPRSVYSGFNTMGDWLGTGKIKNGDIQYRSFEEARDYVRSLNLKDNKEWRTYSKSDQKPKDIPANPERNKEYKDQWKGWTDWLGETVRWLPFEEAREFVHSMNFKKQGEYKAWAPNRPYNIPAHPQTVYKNDGWKGWTDWLGWRKEK